MLSTSTSYSSVQSILERCKEAFIYYLQEVRDSLTVTSATPIQYGGVVRAYLVSPAVSFVGGSTVAWITGQGIVAAGTIAALVALTSVTIHTLAIFLLQKIGDDFMQRVPSYTHAALCTFSLASSALAWQVPFSMPAAVSLLLPFITAKIVKKETVYLGHMPLFVWL